MVRSKQRIVTAAMHFRATGTKLERSHCDYPGPPLKPFLFDDGDIEDFATNTVEAMEDLVDEHVPTLSLHDRLAKLVPSEKFRSELAVEMKNALKSSKMLQSRKFKFVTAKEAASVCGHSHQQGDAEQWIVLDSIDEFDGLERLFVIAVGLDQRIDESGSSVFYRAITRAHMLVMVVDRRVQGGWLEFLGHVGFDASKEFSAEEEKVQCNDQAARGAQSKKNKADAQAVVDFVDDQADAVEDNMMADEGNQLVQQGGVKMPLPHVVSALLPDGNDATKEASSKINANFPQIIATLEDMQQLRINQMIWDVSNIKHQEQGRPAFMPISVERDAASYEPLSRIGEQPPVQPGEYVIKAWEQEGPDGHKIIMHDVGTITSQEGEDCTVKWNSEDSAGSRVTADYNVGSLLVLPKFMYRSASSKELELVGNNEEINCKSVLEFGKQGSKLTGNGVRTLNSSGKVFTQREWIADGYVTKQELRGNSGFMTFTDNPLVVVQYSKDFYLQKHTELPKRPSCLQNHILRLDTRKFLEAGRTFSKLLAEPVVNIYKTMVNNTVLQEDLAKTLETLETSDTGDIGEAKTLENTLRQAVQDMSPGRRHETRERLRGSMFVDSHGEWQVDLLARRQDGQPNSISCGSIEMFALSEASKWAATRGWRKPSQADYFRLHQFFDAKAASLDQNGDEKFMASDQNGNELAMSC